MMTTTRNKTNPMVRLYERLGSVGLSRSYLKEVVLPSWWDDEIALNPAGYAEVLSAVSRNLGLDLRSLQNQEGPILRRDLGPRRFKRQAHVSEEELQVAECIALRAAQLACLATSTPVRGLPASAGSLRALLLEGDLPYITFEALIDTCWTFGIPVLHIAHYPKGVRKMDGIAARIGGRPAIVLSGKLSPTALALVHAQMNERLDWECLPDESREFLMRVTAMRPKSE